MMRSGIGSRRIDILEEHEIFSATTVFFRADSFSCHRRAASADPRLSSRRTINGWPDYTMPPSPQEANTSSSIFDRNTRSPRRLSADGTNFQPNVISYLQETPSLPAPPYDDVSPGPSKTNASPSSSTSAVDATTIHSTHSLDEFRNGSGVSLNKQRS